ncbi:MAG TPA: NifU family protein [Armatimonadota bacterium]|nr:NifU family protein [Armatimonadota bacterium]
MREQVEKVLDEIRPALQADGGDIELVDVNEETGVVEVKLVGACAGCPMSQLTLQMGVERVLKGKVPGVTKVENVGMPAVHGDPGGE